MCRLALALLLLPAVARAESFGPWETRAAPVVAEAPVRVRLGGRASGLETSPFFLSFKFYQQVISAIDGPRCAHRPTCSLYAIQAMHKHPFLGSFLALDRLWRGAESSAIRPLPLELGSDGALHFHDPLEESDFWLH